MFRAEMEAARLHGLTDLTPLYFSVGPRELSGVSDLCGHCGRSTCTRFGSCTGDSTDSRCNVGSVPEYDLQVQCVQRAWWWPY